MTTLTNEIATLVEEIKKDYAGFNANLAKDASDDETRDRIRANMTERFNNGIEISEGKKYIKIITNRSVWGFIVKGDDDKKFRKGDILKAASWATPARNAARGNVIDGGYTVRWTGPLYLK